MRIPGLVLFFSALLFFNACKKETCNISSSEKGLIITGVNVSSCFPDLKVKKQWLIQRKGQWDSLFTGNINTSCFKPDMDFTKITILGLYAEGGGCQTAYHREVVYDSASVTYTYKVSVENCGSCDLQSFSYNFVAVPKISDTAHVNFELH